MKKDGKTLLDVVEMYHQRYIEYEKAFNNKKSKQNELKDRVIEMVKNGVDPSSKEFEDKVVELNVERPEKAFDVEGMATKFYIAAHIYTMLKEGDLPEDIKKDYDNSVIAERFETTYSVKNGEMIRNTEMDRNDEFKEAIRGVYKAIQKDVEQE